MVGRIGIFGSMFNPPHVGHLLLFSEAAWQLDLERVILVPTARPGHRPPPAESADVRARMAAAAAADEPVAAVSRIELERAGPSYTVDTLRELALRYPAHELVLLLGADQLASLGSWHEAEQVPRLATIAVAPRPGVELSGLDQARVERIEMPQVAISSSLIRTRVAAGQPIRHLVPEAVRTIIEAEGLYRTTREPAVAPVVGWPQEPWLERSDP